ncbi:hypothetical protein FQA39_LY11706 [Lamprigera yunnana]|nr:hypothetical protein FQA39_LY11706 [Lamprigera yunnana]
MKLLFIILCFHEFSCSLNVTEQENYAKKCVEYMINNVTNTNATLMYVYHNTSDDLLPGRLENPTVVIDASTNENRRYSFNGELVFLNLKDLDFMFKYIPKMMNLKTTMKRKYLLIFPLKEEYNFTRILSFFFKHRVIDVIIMVYDFSLRSDTVKVFTWNPYYPSNDCGTQFNAVEENSCKMIRKPRRFSYDKCKVYSNNLSSEINQHSTVVNFLLSTLSKTLNLTLIPMESRSIKGLSIVVNHFYQHHDILKVYMEIIRDSSLIGVKQQTFLVNDPRLLSIVNKIVMFSLESGLIIHEVNEYQKMKMKNSSSYKDRHNLTEEKIVTLGLKHLYPLFVFWGIGLAIAAAAFAVENATFLINKKLRKI